MKMESDSADAPGFRLRFEQRPGYLLVEVRGRRGSPEIALAAFASIAAECTRLQARKLLVVDAAHGTPNSPQALAGIMRTLRESPLATVRIAYVVRDVENIPVFQHAELEGLDLGFNLRLFASERDAEIWLLYSE
ncbi:MAG: hypothetical protein JSR27_00340 [Proteobacteria bacterium]|nr:hypothetical protein [Pseudomonadota bacterium]